MMVSAAVRAWAEKDAQRGQRLGAAIAAGPGTRSCLAGGRLVIGRNRSAGRARHVANASRRPATDRQNFYWPIFSRWASTDPVTAAQQAAQLPPGSGHDNAVQVVASTWASQDREAAFTWATPCHRARVATARCRRCLSTWANKDPQGAANMRHRHCAPGPHARSGDRQYRATMGPERSHRRARLDPGAPGGRGTKPRNAKRSLQLGAKRSDGAADYVAALPAGKTQEDAVKTIAQQLATADVQTALSWAQKLPDGPTRQNALNPIVAQWSETDPARPPSLPCATPAATRAESCSTASRANGLGTIPRRR